MLGGEAWGLIGHDLVVRCLQDALVRGRLAHAYLIVGPPGTGKTSLAIALAQTLNCTGSAGALGSNLPNAQPETRNPQPVRPCLICSACRRAGAGAHPDVVALGLEPNQRELGIDRVRELQKLAALRPYEGRWRVFIIRDADRMSNEAANALLKVLEEPPPQVVLLLLAASADRVLPTLHSRCQALHLRRVPVTSLAAALADRFALPLPEAEAIAAFAGGRPGDAIRTAQTPELLETVVDDLNRLRELLEADIPERLELAASLGGATPGTNPGGPGTAPAGGGRTPLLDLLARWERWWRDLLLVHQGCTQGITFVMEREAYLRCAPSLSLAGLRRAIETLQRSIRQLEQNALPRLVLDVLVLELPLLPRSGVLGAGIGAPNHAGAPSGLRDHRDP